MQITSRIGRIVQLDGILLAILITSLAINVYLGVSRNQAAAAPRSRPELIPTGSSAPVFEGTTLAGGKVTVDFRKDKRATLLYVFSPTCHWCERNLANITAIMKARPDLHVIGVNVGPPLDNISLARQPFSEILTPTRATAQAYRFSGTPSTLLISSSAKVLGTWTGAYAGPIAADISQAFAVSLPGLLDDRAPR